MVEVKRANIRAYVGATGSGKGVSIAQWLEAENPARLVIFDPLHEYGQHAQPVERVADVLRAMEAPRFRVAWQPDDDTDYNAKAFRAQFALFCRGCFVAGDLVMLVEEAELVTRPQWAPPAWRNCTKRGRHQGLTIIAAAQRPADMDKAFLSGCTFVRCFALREHADRQRMAQALDVDQAVIDALQTTAPSATTTRIVYFEKDFNTGESGPGEMVLRRRKR